MAIRILRRKVIIREYDFEKVKREAFMPVGLGSIYDRAEFTPLDQEALEKLKLVVILKGKQHDPLLFADWNNNIPAMLLYNLKDYLYNQKYYEWNVSLDNEGYVCVQARKNTPKSRIGYAVFEKDLVSRL